MTYRSIGLSIKQTLNDVFKQANIEAMVHSLPFGTVEAILYTTEHDEAIRNKTIDDCIAILLNIMPPEPYLLKSKHYENWKMKTTELRMLRDMLEQMKGVQR